MQNDEIEKTTHKKLRKKSDFQKKHLAKKNIKVK
jgi:hypothetical protein